MEIHRNANKTKDNDEKKTTHTYVFALTDDMTSKSSPKWIRKKLWQIFPSVCASVLCLPFGMMLGWPSPTYPNLLSPENSPIPISLDQSAMIAGFLMIGNSVTTPFSSSRRFGSKYGIIFGTVLMIFGWIIMWLAKDIYYLLMSRFLVGAGNGFGTGQLKLYISEITESDLSPLLIKQIPLYTYFGVVLAFSIGPFVSFTQLGIISLIVAIFVMFLAIFLPSTPRELVKSGKLAEAKKLIEFLSLNADNNDINQEIADIRKGIERPNSDLNIIDLMRNPLLRRNFFTFALLIFFQQFTGPAATIIYSQILFTESRVPHPQYCAIIYSIVFLISNILGIFISPKYNKKLVLMISNSLVIISLITQILAVIFEVNDRFWGFTSLFVMLFYIISHTLGLGNIPFTYMSDLFPQNCTKVVAHYFIISHSILALLITKIFQVMYERLGFYTPFCLFLLISAIAFTFISVLIPASNKFKIGANPDDVNVNNVI